jgi:hypothetical protein
MTLPLTLFRGFLCYSILAFFECAITIRSIQEERHSNQEDLDAYIASSLRNCVHVIKVVIRIREQ